MHRLGKRKIARAIRESIDSYPGGLSLTTKSGLPILVNACMNRLIYDLTGHTLLEAEVTWEELKQGRVMWYPHHNSCLPAKLRQALFFPIWFSFCQCW